MNDIFCVSIYVLYTGVLSWNLLPPIYKANNSFVAEAIGTFWFTLIVAGLIVLIGALNNDRY